ncbi:MAG: CARDB domain-containing protein [Chloroflexota bacterium]
MKRRLIIFTCTSLLIFLAATACQQAVPTPDETPVIAGWSFDETTTPAPGETATEPEQAPAGQIERINDRVELGAVDGPLQPLEDVAPFFSGDAVRVRDGGEGLLDFNDQMRLRLFNDTRLEMIAAETDPDAPLDVRMFLVEGGFTGQVLADGGRAELNTPGGATIVVLGTDFYVVYDPQAELTYIGNFAGSVDVRVDEERIVVPSEMTVILPQRDRVPLTLTRQEFEQLARNRQSPVAAAEEVTEESTPTPSPTFTPTATRAPVVPQGRTLTPAPPPTLTHTPRRPTLTPTLTDTPTPTPTITLTVPSSPPDLYVSQLVQTTEAFFTEDGQIAVPVAVTIVNGGGSEAERFKVSAHAETNSGIFLFPFTVPGQNSTLYPFTTAPLEADDSITFSGDVLFDDTYQGQTVALFVQADSCAGEEIFQDYCRVEESDEDNWSAPIGVALPAEPAPADLSVEEVFLEDNSCPEGPGSCVAEVSFTVVNLGGDLTDSFAIRVALDPDQSVIVTEKLSGLREGEAQRLFITTPPGDNCFDPDCTICVFVDSESVINESDEGNNELCETHGG